MIPRHVTYTGPHEHVPGERVKIYVSFENEAEMKRGVDASRSLGGIVFLGVATCPRAPRKMFAVFESENDASQLMADILTQGVRIISVVVKGDGYVRGLTPVVVQCGTCGANLLYETHFSSSGAQLCDQCLRKMIEGPVDKEGS